MHYSIMMSMQRKEIKAVHIADLKNLLKKYGQLEDFSGGHILCTVCNDSVSPTNVGSMQLADARLVFTCNKISCYNQIVKNVQ